jgi:hypothetical protein
MQEKCKFKTVMMGKITILLFFISLVAPCQITFADQKSHYAVARQLVELTYNEKLAYEMAQKFALLAAKDSFENDPKMRDYSVILTNLIMEVLDAYFHDIETQNKMKMAFTKTYVEEFTEYELKEFVRFYKTPIGKKALQKLPAVTQKCWESGSEIGGQISSSPKYHQMLVGKVKALQDKGALPKEIK